MHRYFADWYRIATIEPQPDVLDKRWEAISGVVGSLDVDQAFELVRLFYGSPRTEARFVERYRDAFKARDVTFPMRDNDAELRVLAGATIVSLLDGRGGPVADAAALAMVCGDCRGRRPGERIADMLGEARGYLSGRSADLRAPRVVKTAVAPTLDVDAVLEPLRSALEARQTRDPGFEGILEPLQQTVRGKQIPILEIISDAIHSVAAAVAEVAAETGQVIHEQSQRFRLQREDTDILWWLFAEHSRDLGHRMAELPLPGACLLAGKELADLTQVLPGPLAAAGVLDKMLRVVEPQLRGATAIQEAVNGTPRGWRAGWARTADCERVEDLCPVLFAVRRSLDTNGPDDWTPPVAKVTGVDPHAAIGPLDLAVQVYEERLLVSAIRQSA